MSKPRNEVVFSHQTGPGSGLAVARDGDLVVIRVAVDGRAHDFGCCAALAGVLAARLGGLAAVLLDDAGVRVLPEDLPPAAPASEVN